MFAGEEEVAGPYEDGTPQIWHFEGENGWKER